MRNIPEAESPPQTFEKMESEGALKSVDGYVQPTLCERVNADWPADG
jgi:hypothetical protein